MSAVRSLALVLAALIAGTSAMTLAQSVESLRELPINASDAAGDLARQDTSGRFERSYRSQPPLVPHRIEGYEIDIKVNKCLSCHDWTVAAAQGAPKVSETHYVTREGVQLDTVASTRWFCNQCHVPQANAAPLVSNTFTPSHELN
ncbi:MAG: nitrate reductase cytochrome c-type subunit [Geminicoccaceae bacterium]